MLLPSLFYAFVSKQKDWKELQNEVLNSIVDKFSSFTVVRDRRIHGGCSAKRPDVLIDLGYQVVIVKVDENQHKTYDCSCENKRIMELSQDVNHCNIVFIRFNPDYYVEISSLGSQEQT